MEFVKKLVKDAAKAAISSQMSAMTGGLPISSASGLPTGAPGGLPIKATPTLPTSAQIGPIRNL